MVKQIVTNFSKHKTVFHKNFFFFLTFYVYGIWQMSKKCNATKEWHYTKWKNKTYIETSWTEGLEMFNMGGFS